MKPVELFAYLMRQLLQAGGTVLDPFAGSGHHADRRRADRPNALPPGTRPALLPMLIVRRYETYSGGQAKRLEA